MDSKGKIMAGKIRKLTNTLSKKERSELQKSALKIIYSEVKIVISPLCRKNNANACKVTLDDLIPEIIENLHMAEQGYRAGVLLVPLNASRFKGQIKTLSSEDSLTCKYISRIEGETERKEIRVKGTADNIVAVQAVLYANNVLKEGNENSDPTADYEVVTILTKLSNEAQPMPPETLMANHFLDSGGTATNMNADEFVASLKSSYFFWRNKAIVSK